MTTKRLCSAILALALGASLCGSALGAEGAAFSDVPAGSWYEAGVSTCAQAAIMVGTGEGLFSPEGELTQAECLTLAFRLYDRTRLQEHSIGGAPAEWGKMTLTLADGTIFEGYGIQSGTNRVFTWWSGQNGYEGLCVQVPGWSDDDPEAGAAAQRAWMDAHPDICGTADPATLTLNGVTYQGTTNCWMPVGSFVLQFQPETETAQEVNAAIHHAVYREVGPDRWWRDTCYAIVQRGLEDIFDPAEFTDGPADRGFFAAMVALAGENTLEKKYTVEEIPDLAREKDNTSADAYRDAVYQLYEAGILNGVDSYGTFRSDKTLTRAECAVMVGRVLEPSQRLDKAPEPFPYRPYTLTEVDLGSWEFYAYGASAGFFPVVERDENEAIRDSGIYRADGVVFCEELEGGAAYNGEGPGYCDDTRYTALLRFDEAGNSQYALFDVEAGAIVVPYQDYEGYLAQAQAYQRRLPLFPWDGGSAYPIGLGGDGGAVIPSLYDRRYYNDRRIPVTGFFDWVGPVGEDGAGFVKLDGKVYRIQF